MRKPNLIQIKATMVLKISLDQASAKIRTGGPVDEKADHSLDVWAGHVPVKRQYLPPITDELIDDGREVSPSVQKLLNQS